MKNLKPFDVREALAGKAVVLRDGRKAYVRHHETELLVDESMRLFGFRADGYYLTWCESGTYYASDTTSEYDIMGMHQETRIINEFEVPLPETQAPERGTTYYSPDLMRCHLFASLVWDDDDYDFRMLNRGLVFLNLDVAIATAKAMLGVDPYGEDEL